MMLVWTLLVLAAVGPTASPGAGPLYFPDERHCQEARARIMSDLTAAGYGYRSATCVLGLGPSSFMGAPK